jgi:molybdate transport system substrate-binding protein
MTESPSSLRVLAAGSLRHALPAIADTFSAETGIAVSLVLGPAGLLRERIEAGEAFDLFASANMAHPQRLASAGLAQPPICFARNRLCIVSRAELELSEESFTEVLANSTLRIGTSTPGDDPAGDYAFEMFDRIEASQPGLGLDLKTRARQLVDLVDLMVSYWSNARLCADDPALKVMPVPKAFAPAIEYGATLSRHGSAASRRLRDFLLSSRGQAILRDNGFSSAVR